MFRPIFSFELGRLLRSVSTWVYFTLFLAMSFMMALLAGGAFEGADLGMDTGGKVHVNSPYQLAVLMSGVSVFTLLVNAAVAGRAVNQDYAHRTYALLFTAPISKRSYLAGRFAAALVVLTLIQLSLALGFWLGSLMPFVDQQLLGPQRVAAYFHPYLVLLLPNLLVQAAAFFAIGTLSRGMRAVYLSSVLVIISLTVAGALSEKLEHRWAAALLDPFGSFAFNRVTEYFTVVEKNLSFTPISGVLLWNRLLWLAVAGLLLLYTYRRFSMTEPLEGGRAAGRKVPVAAPQPPSAIPAGEAGPRPALGKVRVRALALMPRLTWLLFRDSVKKVSFGVVMLAAVGAVVIASLTAGAIYGTRTYPVTYAMVDLVTGAFGLFTLILLTLNAGELVHREREARVDQIIDASPVPSWVFLGAKLGALILLILLIQLVALCCGVGVQLAHGYYKLELGLYARELLGMSLVRYAQLAVMALFLHVLCNHKALGNFAMLGFFIVSIALPKLGFEHRLYLYGKAPGVSYSDMNGFGGNLAAWAWFSLYWSLGAALLVLLANLFWVRGQETSLRARLRLAWARLSAGGHRTGLFGIVAVAVAFAATGGFIFYNTNVLNEWTTTKEDMRRLVEHEQRYKRHEKEPQPKITEVKAAFDIFPHSGDLRVRGSYRVVNKTTGAIPAVYMNLPHRVRIHRLSFGELPAPTSADPRLDFYTFALPRPLAPGADTTVEFDLEYAPQGFTTAGRARVAARNGTFVNSGYLPSIGYQPAGELGDDDDRRKRGLGTRPRMADLDDPEGRQRNYISRDADFVTLEASACTSADQIVIIPGYLQREWRQGDRRCFAFKNDAQVLHFFSVLSARYQVRRDRWKDVAIEIYYHPGHEYNLDRMVAATKESLEYFSTNFSPYQHRQLRIVEFPRYASFAQSFSNTIPYSESVGFIAKVDPGDEDDIDYPTSITAHEVAHQWWAHQIVGADVQGATMLSESLSQYSALMVLKKLRGEHEMKRFLRYELDQYLAARGSERKRELPLVRVEGQAHIHYAKASLAFYALADQVGEATVNRALASLLKEHAFRGPPYPRSVDLIDHLKRVVPPAQHGLISDLLETITLYDNRAVKASARAEAGGMYEVKLKLSAKKLRADEQGKETEIPFADPIDIGVLDEDGKPLLLEKRTISAGEREIVLRVKGLPARAGIDPHHKLIDRVSRDNLVRVEL